MPTTAIQIGMPGGSDRPNSTQVTKTAEVTSVFVYRVKMSSVRNPARFTAASTTSARQPKKYTEATTAGTRAYSTRFMGSCQVMEDFMPRASCHRPLPPLST